MSDEGIEADPDESMNERWWDWLKVSRSEGGHSKQAEAALLISAYRESYSFDTSITETIETKHHLPRPH